LVVVSKSTTSDKVSSISLVVAGLAVNIVVASVGCTYSPVAEVIRLSTIADVVIAGSSSVVKASSVAKLVVVVSMAFVELVFNVEDEDLDEEAVTPTLEAELA
jgi:hypothetical protein